MNRYIPSITNVEEALQALKLISRGTEEFLESSVVITFRTLFHLVKDNPTNQASLGNLGACELVISILNRFVVSSPILSQECLSVIHILCRCSDNMSTSSESNISAFASSSSCISGTKHGSK